MRLPPPIKRLVKFLFYFIGLILLAGTLVLLLLVVWVDPEDYRETIEEGFQTATGRELKLAGSIQWSLFPWLGIETGAITVGNPPDFPAAPPFARIQGAALKLRLWPLLRGKLELGRIQLQAPVLHLQIDARGRNNWSQWSPPSPLQDGGRTAGAAPGSAADLNEERTKEQAFPAALVIGGIQVREAVLDWRDRRTGSRLRIENLHLETDRLTPGRPARWQGSLRFTTAQADTEHLRGSATFSARLGFDLAHRALNADPLRLEVQLQGAALPPALETPLAIELHTRLAADLDEEGLLVDDLRARIDQSTLTGNLRLTDFRQPHWRFDLRLDRLDVDRYWTSSPASSSAPGSPPAPAVATPATGALALPAEALRALDLDGRLTVERLAVQGLQIQDLSLQVRARDGLIRLAPRARLYQGRYQGDVTLDLRRPTPRFTLQERLSGIQAAPLLEDLMGRAPLSGAGDVSLALQGELEADETTTEELLRRLQGRLNLTFRDGALQGIDLEGMIRLAAALGLKDVAPAGTPRTPFTRLDASIEIARGQARNADLRLAAPFLRARGQGRLDLLTGRLDYRLLVRLVQTAAGQGGPSLEALRGLDVPVRIDGHWRQPRFRVDRDFIEQKLRRKGEKKLREKLQKKLEKKLRERDLDERLQRRLEDALDRLL